jgi:hypothetical protein
VSTGQVVEVMMVALICAAPTSLLVGFAFLFWIPPRKKSRDAEPPEGAPPPG